MTYATEDDLDQYKLMEWAKSHTLGDEDFDVFKCPNCKKIYLLEYEAGTVFVSGSDPSALFSDERFRCVSCHFDFDPRVAIVGPNAEDKYKVKISDIQESEWNWALKSNT